MISTVHEPTSAKSLPGRHPGGKSVPAGDQSRATPPDRIAPRATRRRSRDLLSIWVVLVLIALPPVGLEGQATTGESISAVDRVFEGFDSTRSPGCVVGVGSRGEAILERAYGMAHLEHGVANGTGTIFEAGSVSKQFTAAAVILLALEGELSLEDDVRRWVPELPDYGETITLRHMMTHTSGLRDWGSVASIAGWGRSARTHDHDHVLDILRRQSALNFPPGDQYSYSNSGYNLLAIVVARASGVPFAEFSREHLFEPLGLVNTEWRDDYRRIVPGRAAAYAPSGPDFRIDVPIEDVHGNGGLLTTVRDLLTWNEHLRAGTLGDAFMREMHRRGILNDGDEISYAGGLQFGSQKGTPRISHTGATSGYRAYLALFPEEALSVALLCNASSANPGVLGGQVAEIFLPDAPPSPEQPVAGADGPPREEADDESVTAPAFAPGPAELETYVGEYHSADAETTLRVVLEEEELLILRRPATRFVLLPGAEPDTFESSLGTIRFLREEGRMAAFSVNQARVHDLRFHRVE